MYVHIPTHVRRVYLAISLSACGAGYGSAGYESSWMYVLLLPPPQIYGVRTFSIHKSVLLRKQSLTHVYSTWPVQWVLCPRFHFCVFLSFSFYIFHLYFFFPQKINISFFIPPILFLRGFICLLHFNIFVTFLLLGRCEDTFFEMLRFFLLLYMNVSVKI